MVPEDRELDRQDHSSSMGSARSGLVGITSSPARSSPRHTGNGRSSHIKFLENQAVINAVKGFLPHLRSRVVRLMGDNAVTVAYIKNEGGTRSYTLMRLTIHLLKWCDRKAIRLVPVHLPGVHNVQADALSRISQTLNNEWTLTMEHLRPAFTKWGEPQIEMFATFANRRLIKFISPYSDRRAEWMDTMSTTWDNGRGLLYAFPPFKLVSQVLQKIYQSHGGQMILVAPKQETASWYLELLELAQEDPIPLYVEGQPLLTQDVILPEERRKHVTTGRQIYRHGDFAGHLEGKGTFTESCRYDCQDPYVSHRYKCLNHIGEDSSIFVGQNHGKSSMSEVIISVHISCIYSETDCFHRPSSHIAHQWLLCCITGSTILQRIRTSSWSSGHSGWNDLFNAELCLSGIYI